MWRDLRPALSSGGAEQKSFLGPSKKSTGVGYVKGGRSEQGREDRRETHPAEVGAIPISNTHRRSQFLYGVNPVGKATE